MTGLVLETAADCQLHCPFCFLRSYTERPEPKFMPLAVVEAVAPFLSGLASIDLTGWGEPLLNPRFFDIVALIRKNFSGRLTMTTNGLLLTIPAVEAIIESGMESVCVSVDAADERAYRSARPGGDFNRLVKNLREFVKLRGERPGTKPLLFATFLMRRTALPGLAPLVRMSSRLGLDGVVFQQMTGVFSDRGLREITHSGYYRNRFEEEELAAALAQARTEARPGFIIVAPEKILAERVGNCGGFDLSRPFITTSGLVSACCAMAYPCALLRRDGTLERTASVVFGDAQKKSLPEIWLDPAYVETRRLIRAGQVPPACGDCIALYMKAGEVKKV